MKAWLAFRGAAGECQQNARDSAGAAEFPRFRFRRHEPQLAPWQERLAKRQMQAGVQTSVRIKDIAHTCRLSPRYFVTAFTNTVGQSPYRWFLECRIARSQQLLLDGKLTLAEIALDCGFTDQSHFTRVFNRVVGLPPGAWQRQVPIDLGQRLSDEGIRFESPADGELTASDIDIQTDRAVRWVRSATGLFSALGVFLELFNSFQADDMYNLTEILNLLAQPG